MPKLPIIEPFRIKSVMHNDVNANPSQMVEIVEDSREWTIGEMYRSRAFWSIGIMFGAMT